MAGDAHQGRPHQAGQGDDRLNTQVTGVQAWDAKGQSWGLDPAQVPAAQANPAVTRIRITYKGGRQVEMKQNIRNPTVPKQS